MIVQVAIPVHHVRCKIWTDDTRDWSIVHEAVLATLTSGSLTLGVLSSALDLPRQVVVAAIARLMRHRLVEVTVSAQQVFFGASAAGTSLVHGGGTLPRFPRESAGRARVVVERYSGCRFRARELRLQTSADIKRMQSSNTRVVVVDVADGSRQVDHNVTLEAVAEIVERGGNRRLLRVDSNTVVKRSDQYMLVSVVDGVPRLPQTASASLASMVVQTAAANSASIGVQPVASDDVTPRWTPFSTIACDFHLDDLIIGGSAHGTHLRQMLEEADSRVVLHSTFLEHEKFLFLVDTLRAACSRGVKVDILWGAEAEDPETGKNVASSKLIASYVANDPVLRGAVFVRMRTTGSHAKIILADRHDGSWVATVGSCNWLSSPFQALEASVVLRDRRAVADVVHVLRETVGRRSIADALANELALTANDLRRNASEGAGQAKVTVIVGDGHEAIMRRVSGQAKDRLVICTHRVGMYVRPATILPAMLAASRGVEVQILYTQPNKPMTKQAMREAANEAAASGVGLEIAKKVPLHGKMLLWTPDDVVITSHNWGSASANISFPLAEVGVHVSSPQIADQVLTRMKQVYPQLCVERPEDDSGPLQR